VFDWIRHGTIGGEAPAMIRAFAALRTAVMAAEAAALILEHDLPREAVPMAFLNEPLVWQALLQHMPMTAFVRNLAKLTKLGLLKPFGDGLASVLAALGDAERIRRARLHPLAILMALKIYASGRGDLGWLTWEPEPLVVEALNTVFYTAFQSVEPTGKRILLALDVSGSMSYGRVAGSALTPREASAGLALITAATEPDHHIVAFSPADGHALESGTVITPLPLAPSMPLDDAIKAVSGLPFGRTDCALPMLYALEKQLEVDAFVIYTDSETWAGDIHPVQALRIYRERTGIPAKLVVVGLVSNGFTIADPNDGGMLDVVGFDLAAPALIADFIQN
jgi:60 kDa SS-A/Ro ribonucleoprotein